MILLVLLASCRFEIPEQSRVCEDVATAIAHRVYVCTKDEDRGNAIWHAVTEGADCVAEKLDEDLYPTALEQGYQCVAALTALDCPAVTERGEDVAAWLATDERCARVMVAEGSAADSGGGTR